MALAETPVQLLPRYICYLLNDLRQYYDHLLSSERKDAIKSNVLESLKVESFEDIEQIYSKLLKKLNILFEYLILGYGS